MTRGRVSRLLLRRLAPLPVAAVLAISAPVSPSSAETPPHRVDATVAGTVLSVAVVRVQDRSYLAALIRKQTSKGEKGDGNGSARDGAENGSTGDDARRDDDRQANANGETQPPPRQLVLVDPRDGRTTLVAEGLPSTSRRVAALARDGGTDLLLIAADDGLWTVDPAAPGAARPARADGFGSQLSLVDPAGLEGDGARELAAVVPGRLLHFAAGPGGGLQAVAERQLPRRAERKSWGVRITSPPVHPVLDLRSGTHAPCWAAGPEAVGKRRLRSLVFCAGADEPLEAWSLLPADETVTETLYAQYGERTLLVVLTREKMGLFVKQQLRVFSLTASRNRVGAPPFLQNDTHCPMWHTSKLGFADADGDGRDDLYLACDKGLVDQELRLAVYAGRDIGVLDPRVRAVELDGEYSSWSFGSDWTGDGLPDLVAVRNGTLEVHAGSHRRRRPVEKATATTLEVTPADEVAPGFDVDVEEDGEEASLDDVAIGTDGPSILGSADLGAGRPELVVVRQGDAEAVLSVLSP